MTTLEQALSEIESRANSATLGPWRVAYGGWVSGSENRGWIEAERPSGRFYKNDDGSFKEQRIPGSRICTFDFENEWRESDKNSGFIAAARTDIPKLAQALRVVINRREVEQNANDRLVLGVELTENDWQAISKILTEK